MTIRTALIAAAVALTPPAAQAEWQEKIELDRITGERLSAGIESVAAPESPSPYPLNFVPGWIYLNCGGGVQFGLGEERLIGAILENPIEFSRRDELSIRARIDDRAAAFRAEVWRENNSRVLIFRDAGADGLDSAIVNSGNLLLEIPTVEYGDLYFSFSLAGTRELHGRTCGTDQSD